MKLPHFTLRELFLLVVIAAMGCGWWVERSRLVRGYWNQWRESQIWKDRAESVGAILCELEPGQWIEWNDDPDLGGVMLVKGPGSESRLHGWKPVNQLAVQLDKISAAVKDTGYRITWQPDGKAKIVPVDETP
jgi:hypothetical protein